MIRRPSCISAYFKCSDLHNSRVFTQGVNLRNQENGVSKSILVMKIRVDNHRLGLTNP